MIRTILSLFLFLILSGCPQNLSVGPVPPENDLPDVEYAVLSAVVGPDIARSPDPVFVLYDLTSAEINPDFYDVLRLPAIDSLSVNA